MTPRQRMLIQSTYEMAMPRLSMISDRFYSRLIKRNPEMGKLFKGNMKMQGQVFVRAISAVIQNLDDEQKVEKMLKELGERHLRYGVRKDHYEAASKILISSVRLATGIRFTYEINKAWEAFYIYVINCMVPENTTSASTPPSDEMRRVVHQ